MNISSTVSSYPRLSYEKIKNDILGQAYDLSLNFVGEARGRRINQESRNKSYVPNVLSFPLTDKVGEVYITPKVAKREAKKFDHTFNEHVTYLFIHGLLHLKGYDHGDEMDRLEERYMKKYS